MYEVPFIVLPFGPDAVLAMLIDPSDPASAEVTTRSLQAAAHTLGLPLHVLSASTEAEFDQAFAKLKELGARGLNSGTVLAGTEGLTSMTKGTRMMAPTGAISLMTSKLRFS